MFETRLADAPTMLFMAATADKYEFNRRVDTEKLTRRIDPEGVNLLELVLPYHRASFGPSREPIWPDHHRCHIYCKMRDSDRPVNFYLDVPVAVWDQLMTTERFDELESDPIERGIAIARARAKAEEEDA